MDNSFEKNKYFELINEDGYTYRFKESKNKSAKNILFIHGFATTSEYHDKHIDRLTDDYNYYAIQLPGHGFAKLKHKMHLTPLFYSKYVAEWIERKGFEDLYVIGHSMGGGISIMLSNLVSDRIRKILAITPMNSSMWHNLQSFFSAIKLLPEDHEKNWKYKSIILHKPSNHYEGETDQELIDEANYFLDHLKDFKHLRRNLMSLKLYKELKKSETNNRDDSMVILGEHDGVIKYHSALKRFSSLLNYKIVTFNNSAHLPFIEENEKYIETVLNFFQDEEIQTE